MNWLQMQIALLNAATAAVEFGINWLLQSTLLIAFGLVAGRLLQRRGSAVQSAVYRTTLAAVLICPIATWILSMAGATGWSLAMPPSWTYEQAEATVALAASPAPDSSLMSQPAVIDAAVPIGSAGPRDILPQQLAAGTPVPDVLASQDMVALDADIPSVIVDPPTTPKLETPTPEAWTFSIHVLGFVALGASVAWLLVSVFQLAKLAMAWWLLSRLRRGAVVADPATVRICRELAADLGVTAPEVLCSPYLPSPCLVGLRRPAVLLPEAELSLSIRDVLVHELAHLVRRDCHWNLLRQLALSVFFFQPLLWKLSRRLETTAEEVCDDYVVEFGGDRQLYAHRLVDIAELSAAPVAAAGVGIVSLRSMLAHRVQRIMDTSRALSTRVGNLVLAIVLAGAVVGTAIVGLLGIGPRPSPAQVATQLADEAQQSDNSVADQSPASDHDEKAITVHGRVVDPDGKALEGATVEVTRSRWRDLHWTDTAHELLGKTTTNQDGRFSVQIHYEKLDDGPANNRLAFMRWHAHDVVVHAPGYDLAWVRGDNGPVDRDIELRLERKAPTVRGRLVSLEGAGVPGARVAIKSVFQARPEGLERWLADLAGFREDGLLPLGAETKVFSMGNGELVQKMFFPLGDRLLQGHDALPATTMTDADGRFELKGLGSDRLLELEISGPGIVKQIISVVTREMQPVDAQQVGDPGYRNHVYYGAKFDLVVEPGQTITGAVRDEETGAPLEGVAVTADQGPGYLWQIEGLTNATSDGQGRFRLEGLPLGVGNRLKVTPNDALPYLMTDGIEVPAGDGAQPVDMEVRLRRGVFVRGRVLEQETGKPVDATLQYYPLSSNEHARAYTRFASNMHRVDFERDRYRTDSGGQFQIVIIPGRGILAAQTVASDFCAGLGAEEIKGLDKHGRFATYDRCTPRMFNRLAEIDVPAGAKEMELDLTVSRGGRVDCEVVDDNDKPLSGVKVANWAPKHGYFGEPLSTSHVEVVGLADNETRALALWHEERNLGRVVGVNATDKALRVTLLPCPTLKGRLVDREGEPIIDGSLRADLLPDGDFTFRLNVGSVDSEGRFETRQLLPGGSYALCVDRKQFGFKSLVEIKNVGLGDTIDLGTIDVTSDKRPAITGVFMPSTQSNTDDVNQKPETDAADQVAETARKTDGTITVHGRVLGPGGKPMAGATVFACWALTRGLDRQPDSRVENKIVAQDKSDDKGNFELSFSTNHPDPSRMSYGWHVAAFAPGSAPAWQAEEQVRNNVKDSQPTILTLSAEQIVHGRIVNLEGNPIPGVHVRVHRLQRPGSEQALVNWLKESKEKAPPAKLDDYFVPSMSPSAKSRNAYSYPVSWHDRFLPHGSPALPGDTSTDKDGRFQLPGLGADQLAVLDLESPDIAKSRAQVVVRDMAPVSARPSEMSGARSGTYFGKEFQFVAEPTQPITGTVTDAETGQPLPNLEVRVDQFAGIRVGQSDFLTTRTDEQGRYTLIGAPAGGGHDIEVTASKVDPYFPTKKRLDTTPGLDPLALDFALRRGQWIVGHVTDQETGSPIKDATVEYLPLRDNAFARDYPNYRPDLTGSVPSERFHTAEDGSFRVLAIPGPGILAAIARNEDRKLYASLWRDLVPQHLLQANGHLKAYHPWEVVGYHALREVDLTKSGDDTTIDLQLTRGLTRAVKLVDAQDQAVKGVQVLGRNAPPSLEGPLDDSKVNVIGLRPNEQRDVVFIQVDRRIGKAMTITAGEETTIVLEPCAVAHGRVVDEDGQPIAELPINVTVDHDRPDNWHRPLVGTTTDNDGRFEALLPPGTIYRIWHYSNKGSDFSAECRAQTGAIFELGDLTNKAKLQTSQTDKLLVKASGDGTPASARADQSPEADKAEAKATESTATQRLEFAGSVVDPSGKPVAGAELYLLFYVPQPQGLLTPAMKPLATTDEVGAFRFTSSATDFGGNATMREFGASTLVARKDGFGFAWTQAGRFETSGSWLREVRARLSETPAWNLDETKAVLDSVGQPLKLVLDDVPIRGRVVDINGQPVAGARLTLLEVLSSTTGDLSAWRQAAKQPRADYYSAGMKTSRRINGPHVRSLVTPAATGADGRFVLRGLGQGRIAELMVEGPRIETAKIFVRTEAGERIELTRERRVPNFGTYVYHPADFVYVAGPSAPIIGEVRDANTKRPLGGVTIKSQKRHGHQINGLGEDFVRALTDERGQYHLEGMPVGEDNRIAAVAPDGEIAYLAMSHKAPTTTPDQPLHLDFNLHAGVWLEGRITGKSSGQGLPGTLTYYLTNDNPNYEQARWLEVDLRDQMRSDERGRFRFAVFSGPGLISFSADDHEHYPRTDSILKLDGNLKKPGDDLIKTRPHYLHVQNYHIVAEINPAADARSVSLDLQLDAGQTAIGRVVDQDGKPVTDYRYCGYMAHFDLWRNSVGNKFELQGYNPPTPRTVYFAHTERNLAGMAIVEGSLPAELIVKLQPGGQVKGRLVDADGAPIPNCELVPWSPPLANAGEQQVTYHPAPLPPNVTHSTIGRYETDDQGRFEFACLVPGVDYRVRAFDRSNSTRVGGATGALDAVIKVAAGESRDLGDVKLADDKEVMSKLSLTQRAATSPPVRLPASVFGHLTLPDGQPAAGAHVALVAMRATDQRGGDLSNPSEVLAEGTADQSGAYRLSIAGASSKTHRYAHLIARRDGYGIAWKQIDLDAASSEVVMVLAVEEPIRGRLVDIEGRPAENVRLSVRSILNTTPDDQPSRNGVGYFGGMISQAWLQPVTSDEQGRFTLSGVPAGHGAFLAVEEDDRFAPQEVALNTGMAEQRGPRDGTYRPLVVNSEAREEAVLPLSPAQLFEGTVTYQDTGEPAPHARLTIWASQQESFGSMTSVAGQADENGRYRISPHPGIRFGVNAYPPDGLPYLARETRASDGIRWNAGDRVRRVDVKLRRGVLVRGTVVETETNQPVAGASIQYHPETAHNPNVFDDVLTGWQGIQLTNEAGKFEIVVLPGPGRLLVHGPQGKYVLHEVSERELSRGTPGGRRYYANAIERVEPAVGTEPIELAIPLQGGEIVTGKVVDEQGLPVDKVSVISRLFIVPHSPFWRGYGGELPQPTASNIFEVSGLAPDQEYPVYFLNAERKLGATEVLRAGMPQPTIVLKPCGQATARFVDTEGKPHADFAPTLFVVVTPGAPRVDYDAAKDGKLFADEDFVANVDLLNYWSGPKTDEQGRVTLQALVPGMTYRLYGEVVVYGQQNGKSQLVKEFTVNAGEQRDLGDITVEREN